MATSLGRAVSSLMGYSPFVSKVASGIAGSNWLVCLLNNISVVRNSHGDSLWRRIFGIGSRTVARGEVLFDGGHAITNAPAADRGPFQRMIGALAPGGERVR